MSQPFFSLAPPLPDHTCITRAELAYLEHRDYVESLSPPEEDALMAEACPLANMLYRAINDQAGTEAGVSFAVILEALHLVEARIDQEMRTPDPADCDA